MIIHGSLNYTACGRRKKTVRKVKKITPTFRTMSNKEKEPYRRITVYYPSAAITPHKDMPDTEYKKELSKDYTVAIAYNKGGYQVIPKDLIKCIGK